MSEIDKDYQMYQLKIEIKDAKNVLIRLQNKYNRLLCKKHGMTYKAIPLKR